MLRRPGFSPTERFPARYRADVIALAVFFAATGSALWHRFTYDNWLIDFDIFTYFLPWFTVVGDRLRDGEIPGWTQYFSSGSPVAGDPSAGWLYLPVMIAFVLFTGATAFKAMILQQVLIGGLTLYVFGRRIGFGPAAALLSAIAFAVGPFLYGQTAFTTVAGQVQTWIPVSLLGVECALRSDRWPRRIAWWSMAGFGIAQMSVAWPGQGMLNGMLIVAAWIGYRGLLWPADPDRDWRGRAVDTLATGIGVLIFGLALGAAGTLPRLSVNAQSSISSGDYSNVLGGDYEAHAHDWFHYVREILADDMYFRPIAITGALVVLGLMAPLVAGRRLAVPYFLGIFALASILSFPETVVHRIVYLIPMYEIIHEHSPRRFLWVVSFAPAMLAGATLQTLQERRLRPWTPSLLVIPLGIAFLGRDYMLRTVPEIVTPWPVGAGVVATVLAVIAGLASLRDFRRHGPAMTRIAAAGLIVLVFVAPTGRDIVKTVREHETAAQSGRLAIESPDRLQSDPTTQLVFDRYLTTSDPGTAAAFLQARRDAGLEFRYVGYAGRFYPDPVSNPQSYSSRRAWPDTIAVLVNGRSAFLDLEQIQGYNPTHLGPYVDYFEAMNGGTQDYHWLDPYPSALAGSQLLDMLNVRYIVVSRAIENNRADIVAIANGRTIVYQDTEVTIYENPRAYDRAWIVHDVRPNNDGEGLVQLANGSVDGRQVAFVDGELPPVLPVEPTLAGTERVRVTHHDDDSLTATATAAAPGLVVFSEVYADGWNAYIDGQRSDLLRTNHALRGVPVPPGTHEIELRYEPTALRSGLWITGTTGAGLLGLYGTIAVGWVRRPEEDAVAEVVPVPVREPVARPRIPVPAMATIARQRPAKQSRAERKRQRTAEVP